MSKNWSEWLHVAVKILKNVRWRTWWHPHTIKQRHRLPQRYSSMCCSCLRWQLFDPSMSYWRQCHTTVAIATMLQMSTKMKFEALLQHDSHHFSIVFPLLLLMLNMLHRLSDTYVIYRTICCFFRHIKIWRITLTWKLWHEILSP